LPAPDHRRQKPPSQEAPLSVRRKKKRKKRVEHAAGNSNSPPPEPTPPEVEDIDFGEDTSEVPEPTTFNLMQEAPIDAATADATEAAPIRPSPKPAAPIGVPRAPLLSLMAESPRRPAHRFKRNGGRFPAGWRKPGGAAAVLATVILLFFFVPLGKSTPHVPTHPAHGQAFFNGDPIPQASVVLEPVWTPQPNFPRPHGTIGEDGSFALETYAPEDGAPPGEYRAIVTHFVRAQGEDFEGSPAPRNQLPARYASFNTSGLVVQIKEGQNEIPSFELRP
jgi:hypothetical protein